MLNADDEYFDCAGGHQRQGFWMIYGLYLPKDVLEKVYNKNARRLFFGDDPLEDQQYVSPTLITGYTANNRIG